MVSNKTKLFFVFSLSLIAGIIKTTVINPVGKVTNMGSNMYRDERGFICEMRTGDGVQYKCSHGNKILVEGSIDQGGKTYEDYAGAKQSFEHFKEQCGCN